MTAASRYLQRYAYLPAICEEQPPHDLALCIVVPCYREHHVVKFLAHLAGCEAPPLRCEVLLVWNSHESEPQATSAEHAMLAQAARSWCDRNAPWFTLQNLMCDALPAARPGLSMARKVGLDEALRRMDTASHEGILVLSSADVRYSRSYFVAVCQALLNNQIPGACYSQFQYSGAGEPDAVKQAAVLYELYLHYLNVGASLCGFPYPLVIPAPAISLTATAYIKSGGYAATYNEQSTAFVARLNELGNFKRIPQVQVTLLARNEVRPGSEAARTIARMSRRNRSRLYVPHPNGFALLYRLLSSLPELYLAEHLKLRQVADLGAPVQRYFDKLFFDEHIAKLRQNSRHLASFQERFFQWFNAARVMQFLKFLSDEIHPPMHVEHSLTVLLQRSSWSHTESLNPFPTDVTAQLTLLRELSTKKGWLRMGPAFES